MATKRVRKQVFKKYYGKCCFCGTDIDFDLAKVSKRTNTANSDLNNILLSCKLCYELKKGLTPYSAFCSPDDFRAKLISFFRDSLESKIIRSMSNYSIIETKQFDGIFYFEKIDKIDQPEFF